MHLRFLAWIFATSPHLIQFLCQIFLHWKSTTLLSKQNKWLKVDIKVLYNFAMWVAESPSDAKEETMLYIQKFLHKHMVPYAE